MISASIDAECHALFIDPRFVHVSIHLVHFRRCCLPPPVTFHGDDGAHPARIALKVSQKQEKKDQIVSADHQWIEFVILYPLMYVLAAGDALFLCTFCFPPGECSDLAVLPQVPTITKNRK